MSIIEKCFAGRKDAYNEFTIKTTIQNMLEKYGEDSQIDVCIEEMSELIKELVKYKRSKIHFREKEAVSRENVVEEIGDVMFTIEYLRHIFCISEKDIKQVMLDKAVRTQERYIDGKK